MNPNMDSSLTLEMKPADPPAHGAPSSQIPVKIKDLLIRQLIKGGGSDWEHFATALGLGLEARDQIRIKQGEVDKIETQCDRNVEKILNLCLTIFEDRCAKEKVTVDLVIHFADILSNPMIFHTPYIRLASMIKELLVKK